jgi:hypothetical protein
METRKNAQKSWKLRGGTKQGLGFEPAAEKGKSNQEKTREKSKGKQKKERKRSTFGKGLATALERDPQLAAKIAANPARYAEEVFGEGEINDDSETLLFDSEGPEPPPLDEGPDDDDDDDDDWPHPTQGRERPAHRPASIAQPIAQSSTPRATSPFAHSEPTPTSIIEQLTPPLWNQAPFIAPFVEQPPRHPIQEDYVTLAEDFNSVQPIEQVILQREVELDFLHLSLEQEDRDDPVTEFVVLPEQLQCDWGRDSASWQGFLHDFYSRTRYEKIVEDYLLFDELQEDCEEDTLLGSMVSYFHESHEGGYAPTTLRSRFSALKKFFLHTGRGNISITVPLIESNLSKWDKAHTVKQARVFKKEDYGRLPR